MNRTSRMMLTAITPLLACGDATGASASAVAGEWTYAGSQETAPQATLDGSLSWKGVSGGDASFEGTFALVERLQTGATRTLSGPGAGQLIADTVADFDLSIDGGGRRHIGILRGDSISGDWMTLGAGQAASGHFVLRRKQ